jgi:glycosyltransferase involved in cell wall biosynthesis
MVTAPLVTGLAHHHEVHVFALTHGTPLEDEGRQQLSSQVAGIYTVPGSWKLDLPVLVKSCFAPYPYKVQRFFRKALLTTARELARTQPPDVIHCQNFYTALYAKDLPARKKVLYHENFEALLLERWMETAPNPLFKRFIRIERDRTLRFEKESAAWFDHVVTISPTDESHYRTLFQGIRNPVTIPPAIDLSFYDPQVVRNLPNPFPSGDYRNLVFTGTFSYLANVDAAVWMVENVLPIVNERYPASTPVRLWLVGANPHPRVKQLHHPPQVNVTGTVPDTRPYHYYADLAVVPLRIGGGIRLKILEALALGTPLVSTPIGCEGLIQTEDHPIWSIAGTPTQFAETIIHSLEIPQVREPLRHWVAQRFSPERFIRQMEALYESGEQVACSDKGGQLVPKGSTPLDQLSIK